MIERTEQLIWLLDYLDDLDSDFRVFYRIDGVSEGNYGGLSGPRFFKLAIRTIHYRGAMRDRIMAEQENSEEAKHPETKIHRSQMPHASSPATGSMWTGETKEVPLAQMRLLHPGIIEHQVV